MYLAIFIKKFNRLEFKSKPLILEEAKTKHKHIHLTPDKQNSPHSQFTNFYLNITHQHEQQQEHQHHLLQQ